MRNTPQVRMLRVIQAVIISRLGPRRSTRGTVPTTSSMERGMKAMSQPTQAGGISILRARRIMAGPTVHCQETTLIAVKFRNLRGAWSSSRIFSTRGICNSGHFQMFVLVQAGNHRYIVYGEIAENLFCNAPGLNSDNVNVCSDSAFLKLCKTHVPTV